MPDTTSTSLAYLGQPPPGLVPQKFAPGLISKEGRYEFGCTFSADAKEFYFGVETGPRALIYGTSVVNGNWTPIEALYPDATFTHNDPMLNNAEDRLYFISKLALSGTGSKDDHDIWYAERQGNGWSAPLIALIMITIFPSLPMAICTMLQKCPTHHSIIMIFNIRRIKMAAIKSL